jgi:hypothetical protein
MEVAAIAGVVVPNDASIPAAVLTNGYAADAVAWDATPAVNDVVPDVSVVDTSRPFVGVNVCGRSVVAAYFVGGITAAIEVAPPRS